jgi:uncharacterized FAD-dependent dehydrogenase
MDNMLRQFGYAAHAVDKDVRESKISLDQLAIKLYGSKPLMAASQKVRNLLNPEADTVKLGADEAVLFCLHCGEGENYLTDIFDKLKNTLRAEQAERFLIKVITNLIEKLPKESQENILEIIYKRTGCTISYDALENLCNSIEELKTEVREIKNIPDIKIVKQQKDK